MNEPISLSLAYLLVGVSTNFAVIWGDLSIFLSVCKVYKSTSKHDVGEMNVVIVRLALYLRSGTSFVDESDLTVY